MPAGQRITANNTQGLVSDNPLLVGATTMNSAGLANLPVVSSAHAVIVLDPLRVNGAPEIVVVTAHSASATSATITRGAYGTTARQHPQNTVWVHAPTIDDVVRILTSSTRPADPYQGQIIYETDTDSYVGRAADATWRTLLSLGAWTSFTPTLTQSATVAKTVTYAKFSRVGRTITAQVSLAVTGTGTASNGVLVGLPVNSVFSPNAAVIGAGYIYNASANAVHKATVEISTASVAAFRPTNTSANDFLGTAQFTEALASGDLVSYAVQYEAAS